MRDLYTEVSSRIIAELESGALPWVKPWSATPGQNVPCNAVSNRPYSGCNVAQCDNLPEHIVNGKPQRVRNPDTRDELADSFMAATNADIKEGAGEAYYQPGHDFINMPAFAAFKGADHFYNVAFHELTHWTGHKSRLDRDLRGRFDRQAYAAEELIAELGAAFLAAEFGFDGDVRHAGYIASWIGLLKSDKRAFFTAASKAQQAADYLRGLALREPVEEPAMAA
jgi:antirestriction protein ArdC